MVEFSLGEKSLSKLGVCSRRERSYERVQVGSAGVLAFGKRYGEGEARSDGEVSSVSGIGDRLLLSRERLDLPLRPKNRERAMMESTFDTKGHTR